MQCVWFSGQHETQKLYISSEIQSNREDRAAFIFRPAAVNGKLGKRDPKTVNNRNGKLGNLNKGKVLHSPVLKSITLEPKMR